MRRFVAAFLVMALILSLLTGCGKGKTNKIPEPDYTEVKVDIESYLKTMNNRPITPEAETEIEEILSIITPIVTLSYPIDDSFMLWFYARYGETILHNLLEDIKEGKSADCFYDLTGDTLHVLWVYYCADTKVHTDYLKNVYTKEVDAKNDIILSFAGDINFDDTWPNMKLLAERHEGIESAFSEDLVAEMKNSDIFMINNECTYTVGGDPLEGKAYTFKARPECATYLRELGVDIVSLANNHVYDYGAEGLLSTIDTLNQLKMPFVGAGNNIDEASKIVYFIINGKKIAFTSATQVERSMNYTKEATSTTPGVLKTLNPEKYAKVIEEADKKADYVIAFVHWGTEDSEWMGADQRRLAMRFIEEGADVVVGGHTHCLQGIEYFNRVPIIYSLGNYWFDWNTEISKHTMLFQIKISDDTGVTYRMIPCEYENGVTRMLTYKEERMNAYSYYKMISDGILIDDEGYITKDPSYDDD